MRSGRVAVFALVIGLVGGYQVGGAEPGQTPPAPVAASPTRPTVEAPTRVLLVGDSILRQTGPALARRLGRGFTVRNVAVNGSGLLTPALFDWPGRLARELSAPVDVVVFSFIGNYTDEPDRLWVSASGQPVTSIESAAFARKWGRQTEAAMAAIGAVGAEAVLVLPPPMPAKSLQRVVDALRREYARVARGRPFIHLADAADRLAGPGTRSVDGVHLSDLGERILAAEIAATLGA